MKRCTEAMVLGGVASEVILAGELVAGLERILAQAKPGASPEQQREQRAVLTAEIVKGLEELTDDDANHRPLTPSQLRRRSLVKQLLQQQIDTKLICYDAQQEIPEENFPLVEKDLGEKFEEKELPEMIKRHQVETRSELDRKLRAMGSSLEWVKRAFIQQALAQGWLRQQIQAGEEASYDQMLVYYRQHLEEFDKQAGTTWEQLMVRFSEYPRKEVAYAAIAAMGNSVLGGKSFAEVAKTSSHGPTASQGGIRDWPSKALISSQLQKVVTELPAGQMSTIQEDWRGYHIIRVVERHQAGRTPFEDAQQVLRAKIRQQRTKQQWNEYVQTLKKKTPVWTIFDDRPRSEQVSDHRAYPRR